ncbi:MAG: hypothetical protein ACYSWW_18220 [Planctomycetota bacterium]|jgi:flagellar basal body rod protein FlgB
MNLTSLATDNITEMLTTIVKFTQTREKILLKNIINVHSPGFVPQELEVDEFSVLLISAIEEHVRNQRLVLCDTENIKFGTGGSLELKPIVDVQGEKLLLENQDEYIEWQIDKLWENLLSQKVAAELLRQKEDEFAQINC